MYTLNCKGSLLVLDKPLVMGIINVTPDSFFEASRFTDTDNLLKQVEKMLAEGADIIDIGGQSTRPGSIAVSEDEELTRVQPVVEKIHAHFPAAIISIDTYYSRVAKEAVSCGASVVNDISAGNLDENMIPIVASLEIPYILMHMKGTPQTMSQSAEYENILVEVMDFFIEKKEQCRKAGMKDVIIDPGFGFAKTIQHNFRLLKNLSLFKILDAPILVGISRKSTIYKTLGVSPEEALNGSTVLHSIALMNGANILRVHDVKEAKEAVKLWEEVSSADGNGAE